MDMKNYKNYVCLFSKNLCKISIYKYVHNYMYAYKHNETHIQKHDGIAAYANTYMDDYT